MRIAIDVIQQRRRNDNRRRALEKVIENRFPLCNTHRVFGTIAHGRAKCPSEE